MDIRKAIIVGCCYAVLSPVDSGQQVGVRTTMNPYESIEKRASSAVPEDPNSVAALADEILSFPRSFPRMPSDLANVLKERLVQAEISYQQGKKAGVREDAVVATINELADRLGAPSYFKTSLSQVRILRMSLALTEPGFMGAGVARASSVAGEPVNPTLGPLQAVHLIDTLIDQKFRNPDFQVSQEEWEGTSRQKVISEVQANQARIASAKGSPGGPAVGTLTGKTYSSQKRRELEEAFFRSISRLTNEEALGLLNHSMTTLGTH